MWTLTLALSRASELIFDCYHFLPPRYHVSVTSGTFLSNRGVWPLLKRCLNPWRLILILEYDTFHLGMCVVTIRETCSPHLYGLTCSWNEQGAIIDKWGKLHGVTTQKTVVFIVTATVTSNGTLFYTVLTFIDRKCLSQRYQSGPGDGALNISTRDKCILKYRVIILSDDYWSPLPVGASLVLK